MEILEILALTNNIWKKKRKEENLSQEFRLKNIDDTRNYFPKEVDQNELISKKQKTIFLNYIEHFSI